MEDLNNSNIDTKTAGNALATYFLVFISWFFLFNKTNKYINNKFVTSHVKSSSIIHLWFLISYIVFIHYSLFASISFYGFWLNHIIAKWLFVWLLLLLIIWMYKAHNKKYFITWEIISIVNKKQLIDVNNDSKFDEKDKLTTLIAYIPLFGFYNYAKYKNSILIKNITKLNLIITTILIALYISWSYNLSNLILLFYSIFVVFIWINLFVQNSLINVNFSKLPTINKLNLLIKTTVSYLKNYYKNNPEFEDFNKILISKTNNYKLENQKNEQELKKLKDTKLPNLLIYIPFINLIFIFSRKTAQKNHISNWLIITLILSVILIFDKFNYYNTNIYILFIIPIIYWIWYMQTRLSYKMPFIYELHKFLNNIFRIFLFRSKEINKIRKKDEVVNLKVEK